MESKKIYLWLTVFLVVIVGITGVFVLVSDRNGGDIIDIDEGPVILGSYFGEDEKVFYINTVGEIHEYEFEVGTAIRALGLLTPDDGLMSEYKVVSDSSGMTDEYTRIALPNGNTAVLKESQTQVAYIGQFGAVGDGVTDDSKAISAALNSDYSTIVFTPGDYRANANIVVNTGMKTVVGVEGSVIFTDEQYNSTKEFFIQLSADNIIFDGMTIETRAPSVNKYKAQIAVKDAKNIAIDNSTLYALPMDGSKQNCIYKNIDLYTGWENVRIDNCTLTVMTDSTAGGIMAIRDISSRGGKGAQVTNNTITKRSHDEIIWVYGEQTEVSDILISDNVFMMDDSTSQTPNAFTFSSTASIVRNIEFSRNTVIANSTYSLFNVINAHDILIADNDINYTNVGSGNNYAFNSAAVTGGPGANDAVNTGSSLETHNLIIENNNIIFNIPNDSSSRLFNISGVVRNNTATINGNLYALSEGKVQSLDNNEIVINGNVTYAIMRNAPKAVNNSITVNGEAAQVIRYHAASLATDVYVENNSIFVKDGRPSNNETMLVISDSLFNDYSLYVLSNEIVCGFDDYKGFMEGRLPGVSTAITKRWTGNDINATAVSSGRQIFSVTLLDNNPQKIVFGSNEVFGYQKFYAVKTEPTNSTARNIETLQERPHQPDEVFIATITDARGNTLETLESSPTVTNVVWSNNTGSDDD